MNIAPRENEELKKLATAFRNMDGKGKQVE